MLRLRIYTVHVNPSLPLPYEAAEFVHEGFNWTAFLFGGFWALYYRIWGWAALVILLNLALGREYSAEHLSHIGYMALYSCLHLIVGFYGNDWRREKLKRRGFVTADIVTGDSLLRAEQRFFERYFTRAGGASA